MITPKIPEISLALLGHMPTFCGIGRSDWDPVSEQ